MTLPLSVPAPDPVTLMLLAQVAVNVTLALDEAVGVTVYLKLPQPVAGVDGVSEDHVPANASTVVVGVVGVVGVGESAWRPSCSKLAAGRKHARDRKTAAAARIS